jgi:hypothetical protein
MFLILTSFLSDTAPPTRTYSLPRLAVSDLRAGCPSRQSPRRHCHLPYPHASPLLPPPPIPPFPKLGRIHSSNASAESDAERCDRRPERCDGWRQSYHPTQHEAKSDAFDQLCIGQRDGQLVWTLLGKLEFPFPAGSRLGQLVRRSVLNCCLWGWARRLGRRGRDVWW